MIARIIIIWRSNGTIIKASDLNGLVVGDNILLPKYDSNGEYICDETFTLSEFLNLLRLLNDD